jgi:hypothetical protein
VSATPSGRIPNAIHANDTARREIEVVSNLPLVVDDEEDETSSMLLILLEEEGEEATDTAAAAALAIEGEGAFVASFGKTE